MFRRSECSCGGEIVVCLFAECLCGRVGVDKLQGQTTASPSAHGPGVASLADMRQKDAFDSG
jgi:hypothetical protein